ncbi:hypothetical protein KCP73_24640 [Salmonella enterica subsp. enterica]|nr:hypothetical protein KCP73_24640 [Salmonella enterica subsp. enterica]
MRKVLPPIPFAEDTCVPFEHLADYRRISSRPAGWSWLLRHVRPRGCRVLHVRPALDMCDPQQELLMKQISDEVVALTARCIWRAVVGAGKGFRADRPFRRSPVWRAAQK